VNGETPLVADAVIEHHGRNLIIASQVDRATASASSDFVERLVMGLGRPLLLVPNATTSRTLRGRFLSDGTGRGKLQSGLRCHTSAATSRCTITWVDPQKTLEAPRLFHVPNWRQP
jgi:hypothetical protein